MTRAEKKKRLYLMLTLVGICIALAFTGAAVLLVLNFQYIPAIVFAALSAAGYYSAPFFFFAYVDTKAMIRLIAALGENTESGISLISSRLGFKESATEKLLKKAKKYGYIT